MFTSLLFLGYGYMVMSYGAYRRVSAQRRTNIITLWIMIIAGLHTWIRGANTDLYMVTV